LLATTTILLGLGGGTVASAAPGSYRDEVLADNPVSYWRLGEAPGASAAPDELGANAGSYLGGVTLGQAGAIANDPNTAPSLNGTDSYVKVNSSPSLSMATAVTEEAWVKRSRSGVWQVVLGKAANGQSKLENYSLWLNTSNKAQAFFGNGTTYASVTSTVALDTNWHYLVVTYDNASAKLYLDGQLNASSSSSVQLTPNSDPLYIGRSTGTTAFFGGQIDEVAVYSTALSATRVQAHYAKGAADTTPPAVTLAAPANGSSTRSTSVSFSGSAGTLGGDSSTVTVKVYSGTSATGTPIQTLSTTHSAGSYSVSSSSLGDGTYTAQAQQADSAGNIGLSSANTFVVDRTAPSIVLTSPANGGLINAALPTFNGVAGTAAGDSSLVLVNLYSGTTTAGTPLQILNAARQSDGSYSAGANAALADGTYTAQAVQQDTAGNSGLSSANTFTVDTAAPPTPSLGSKPPALTSSTGASFGFSDTEAGVTFRCSLDGAAFGACTSPRTYSGLGEGSHTFQVTARDAAGNESAAASYTWTVDSVAPTTTITDQPPNPSNSASASFSFSANETASFQCRLDGASFSACTSPKSYSALVDGSHTFQVRATDLAGNTGAAATYTWTVSTATPDTTPPVVTLTSPANGASVSTGTPTFAGAAGTAPGDLSTITVRVYAGPDVSSLLVETLTTTRANGAFSVVASPSLIDGTYTAQAQQSDAAGNTGSSSANTFTVTTSGDTTPPTSTITEHPADPTTSTNASFSFTADESASFECSIDDGAFSSCSTPTVYSSLTDGSHTFQVRATDLSGNTGEPAGFSWSVDTTPPTSSITQKPADPTNSTSPSFSFSANETATFQCRLDGGAFSACTSPTSYSGRGGGSHTFQVNATDAAGNTGPAASYTWTIDLTAPPAPTVLSGPASPSGSSSATFGFSDAEAGVSFRCQVDAGSFGVCASPQTYNGLSDGDHVFGVKARDAAGNESTASTYSWTVDTTASGVTLTSPSNGGATSDQTPTFAGYAGTAAGDSNTITVKVYSGGTPTGTPVQILTTTQSGGSYSIETTTTLSEGTYTAQAEQSDSAGNTGRSSANTFVVDTTAPTPTMTSPAAGASTSEKPTFAGTAGAAARDSTTVDIDIFAGSSATGTPTQVLTTTAASNGVYSIPVSVPLPEGTYTAQAVQSDLVENTGTSSAVTFSVSSTLYRDTILGDNPAGYWRLGEASGTTAGDSAGTNSGTYQGGITLGQPGAIRTESNTAASFDAVNDSVSIPSSSSLSVTTAVTLETWVKRSKSGWQVIVGKPGNGQSKFENYALWFNSTNNVVAYFGNGTTAYASVTSPTPLDTNWHLLDASYDNATARLYVDGTLKASVNSTVQMRANSDPLDIGRSQSGSSTYFFGGQQDEVAVYGTALSGARVAAHYNAAFDTTAPVVTLTTPPSLTLDTTPAIAGMAGTTSRDSATVTVKVYTGSSASGTPIQTLSTRRFGSGAWGVNASPALSPGTYTAQAEQMDTSGNIGRSAPKTFVLGNFPSSSDPVLLAAGDIAACNSPGDEATGALLDQFPNATVQTVGDNAYSAGTADDFANCYDPSWGRAKARTHPALGPHDYGDNGTGVFSGGDGYFNYFHNQLAPYGPTATDPSKGYYSYDLGTWHIVVLNTSCNVAPNCDANLQEQWLRADLAAHQTACSLAIWHVPRFSSGGVHGSNAGESRWWQAFDDFGGDLVLNGEDHIYERFAPQDASGFYDATGPRQITVGIGGAEHYGLGTIRSNSEARDVTSFGILKLTLHPTSYDWQSVPEAGMTFTDSGSEQCH